MRGLIMEMPLLISSFIETCRGPRHGNDRGRIAQPSMAGLHRYNLWPTSRGRTKRLARALLGARRAERVSRVGSLGLEHATGIFELFLRRLGGSGAVLHTINPRLFEDQIVFIADHGRGQVDLLRRGDPADSPNALRRG